MCIRDSFNRNEIAQEWIDDWFEEFPETKNKIILTLPTRVSKWKGLDSFIELISKLDCTIFHGLIVGPTSFHWWGAWLNNNKNKICLRPKDINVSNNADLWPEYWISV